MSGREPILNLPRSLLLLCGAMILVHVARQLVGPDTDIWIIAEFAFVPARYSAPSEWPGGVPALFWSPLTYAFLHGDSIHLLVNLFWAASFGTPVARRFGTARFLLLAAVSAVAGSVAHYLVYPGDAVPMIGASAAVSGMTAATARFAFEPGAPLGGGGARPSAYFVPAPPLLALLANARAAFFVLVWFGVNLLFGVQSSLIPGVEGAIAWQAHIGGFVAGLALFPLLDPVRRLPG
ncbi:rhomboid family intramembrane serine protease [Faunimonas sp. B44]|uniref:rhomboid family intramembrane serine protease n=1 Tax=Faunimonas sp. B44 TaxID=3461493 RepID=UPI0040445EC0